MYYVKYILCLIAIIKLSLQYTEHKYYKGGGHIAKWCINETISLNKTRITEQIQCNRTQELCMDTFFYLCLIPCKYAKNFDYIDKKILPLVYVAPPIFYIVRKEENYYPGSSIIIVTSTGTLLLQANDIRITFTGDFDGSFSNISIIKNVIIAQINLSNFSISNRINVTVSLSYGRLDCEYFQNLGQISVLQKPYNYKDIFLKLGTGAAIIVSGLFFYIVIAIRKHRRYIGAMVNQHSKVVLSKEVNLVNLQKRAFLEYQMAVDLFTDLGSLTPRHILSFYSFISRVFNIELPTESSTYKSYQTDDFRTFILNKDNLIKWVEKMEKSCKLQQRSLVASLLSIVLFQHPDYFLEIMKCLLTKYIQEMKAKNEERLVFRRSDAIVEKLIGNWITLCMYRNLKTGEVGKRFFNLYRAIKCKMNQGIVDCLTDKAKYALTFDHIMLGDIESQVLSITVDVKVSLKMMSNSKTFLEINLKGVNVDVLSLDSISQVKEKILDKAIMEYSEKEENCNNLENNDLCIGLHDIGDFRLQFMNSTTKIMLDDFDRTSIRSILDKNCLMVNTMKHYNMKSGMRFLLDSFVILEHIHFDSAKSSLPSSPKTIKVHLQLPQNYKMESFEASKQQCSDINSKLLFNPLVEDMNKESYLMLLMAAKQSVLVFIDGFFQSIFNWNPNQTQGASNNSLFETNDRSLLSIPNINSQNLVEKESYLMPTYFLFSMLDDIAETLDIADNIAILAWKSNSFILRFWVNLIKNPNFIFSVNERGPINGSLTTIASVLMESCSTSSGSALVDVNLPIIKQLFLKELKRYNSMWTSFTEFATRIEHESMVQMMNNIVQTYDMTSYYNSSLTSLLAISNTLIPELLTSEEVFNNSQ